MDENCTIYKTADLIGKRWTLLIILELAKKKRSFNELKASIPKITAKILSTRLKELEKQQIISKKLLISTQPVKSEYSLTKAGKDFFKIIKQIKQWALKWNIENKLCEKLNCLECIDNKI